MANGADPDEMQHYAAFYQDLISLLRLKQTSGTEIHQYLEISTYDPLNVQWTIPSLLFFHQNTKGSNFQYPS